MKIILVAGARPNFMKIAPLMEAVVRRNQDNPRDPIEQVLVHTGQHYDEAMSRLFFDELGIPKPHVNLEVGSGSHARQTAEIMTRFEPIVAAEKPDAVLVVGDVNSTVACALTAVKMGVAVGHIEAGLRSGDRAMPEEINRLATDAVSDYLFTTSRVAGQNLRREGISEENIFLVGNTMIDTLLRHRERARRPALLDERGLSRFGAVTLHRPSNVDDARAFAGILDAFEDIGKKLTLVFPVHPRTRAAAERFGLWERMTAMKGLVLATPLGYLEFLYLLANASLVLTDSGGIQEETTVLGVPCLTLRENTERPETIEEGSNMLVGNTRARIVKAAEDVLMGRGKKGRIPELWDGRAAERIVEALARVKN